MCQGLRNRIVRALKAAGSLVERVGINTLFSFNLITFIYQLWSYENRYT